MSFLSSWSSSSFYNTLLYTLLSRLSCSLLFFPCLDSCLESFKLFLKEPPRSCTTTEEDRLSPCASRLIRQPKLFRNDAHSSSNRVRPSWRDPITINQKCDVLFFLEMSTFEVFTSCKKRRKKTAAFACDDDSSLVQVRKDSFSGRRPAKKR